jgi:thiamine-monophosphate kinase
MERELVDWLRRTLPPHPLLKVGLGDDANLVVTTDSLGDGAHFHVDQTEPRWIGHKCLAANLSDLAAMAAQPLAAVVSLMLPRDHADPAALAQGMYAAMIPLAAEFDLALAGGDTNAWDGPLTVCITAFGTTGPRGALVRSGARPGDAILVTGELGGSIVGHHLDFTPRVREALRLHRDYPLTAGMDITDGLALDLDRLCQASGCGAVLFADAIPVSPAAEQLAAAEGGDALLHALSDGEDFELLLTAPADVAQRIIEAQPLECGVSLIGEITDTPGLQLRDASGATRPLQPTGYLHG